MSIDKQNKEALRWVRQAREDYKTSLILKDNGRFASSCFWSHQAAEKALKAVWYWKDKDPWGHSLQKLIELLEEKRLDILMEDAIFLDHFYIPTRYPNGVPFPSIPEDSYSKKDAEGALKRAKKIVNEVNRILKEIL